MKIFDIFKKKIEKKELQNPIYPSLNNTYNQFQQFTWSRNSPQFGNYDRNLSMLNYTSWLYIFVEANSTRLASADCGLYIPEPKTGYSKKYLRKALKLNERLINKSFETGEDFVRVVDKNNPIIKILCKPNEIQNTFFNFFKKIFMFIQLSGQAPILKLRDDNGVMNGMVSLDPRTIKPVRSLETNEWKIIGYTYYGNNGFQNTFNVEDIIWIGIDSPVSYIDGYSPAQAAWTDIMLSSEKTQADISYSKNRMRPDWLCRMKDTDQKEMERVAYQIEDKLRGSSNTGTMLAVNADQFDLVPLQNFDGYVPGDPDTLIRKLCAYFKYPYALFMSTESNRASADTFMDEWARGIQPWANQVAEQLEIAFREEFPELDEDSELEWESLAKGDKEFELKVEESNNAKFLNSWKCGAIDRYTYLTGVGLEATDADKGVYIQVNVGNTVASKDGEVK